MRRISRDRAALIIKKMDNYKSKMQSVSPGNVAFLDYFLKTAVVTSFDESFGSSLQDFLHLPPVVAVGDDKLANFEVFFVGEVLFVDIGPEVVEVALSDLFGCEF